MFFLYLDIPSLILYDCWSYSPANFFQLPRPCLILIVADFIYIESITEKTRRGRINENKKSKKREKTNFLGMKSLCVSESVITPSWNRNESSQKFRFRKIKTTTIHSRVKTALVMGTRLELIGKIYTPRVVIRRFSRDRIFTSSQGIRQLGTRGIYTVPASSHTFSKLP